MPEPTKPNANSSHDHPIGLELASLRAAVAQFQDESHVSSVKLQRHSLDTSTANERAQRLERENATLRSELAVLRANPLPKESPESSQDKQTLTMALRRLSEELNLADATILERNSELAHARAVAVKAKYAADNAYELAARIRGREEEGKQREFELERRARAAEEEARMSDLVVKEYASLVRSLKHKTDSQPANNNTFPNDNTIALTNSLSEGKIGLQKLLAEFNAETERLNAEVLRLQGELAELGAQLDAEKKGAHDGRLELGKVQLELQRLQRDDNAAAKMVSRYMKFSQHATDVLQTAMDSLRTRHAATVDTLSTQISTLASEIEPLHSTIERLRQALDELTGNILRETYGRRREVALRIRLVGREERTRESLQRFIHRYHDTIRRDKLPDSLDGHIKIIQDAEQILFTLDAAPSILPSSPPDDGLSLGSVARIAAVECGLAALLEELDTETARRLDLERLIARGEGVDEPIDTGNGEIHQGGPTSEQEIQTDDDSNHEELSDSREMSSKMVQVVPDSPVAPAVPLAAATAVSPTGSRVIQHDHSSPQLGDDQPMPAIVEVIHPATPPQPLNRGQERQSNDSSNREQSLDSQQMSPKMVHVPDSSVAPAVPLAEATATSPTASRVIDHFPPPQPSQIGGDQTIPCLEDSPITTLEDIHGSAPITPPLPLNEQNTENIAAPTSAEIATVSRTGSPAREQHVPSSTHIENDQTALCPEDPPVTAHEDICHPTSAVVLSPPNDQQTDSLPLLLSDEHPGPTVENLPQDDCSNKPFDGEVEPHASTPPLVPSISVEAERPERQPSNQDLDSSPRQGATNLPVPETISEDPDDLNDSNTEPLSPLFTEALTSNPRKPPTLPVNPEPDRILPTPVETFEAPVSHPLIARLAQTRHRYDDLQHNLRDCNLALQALKDDLTTSTPNSRVIQTALERLSDYTEDARVELEIRIADEELLARGFETILSVPGALSNSPASTHAGDDSPPSQTEVEIQIEAFVSGTEPSVQRSLQTFARKLADVQHDIAALKQTIHAPDLSLTSTSSPLAAPENETRYWRSWMEKSPSPSPNPTFGNIMTAPRLKHSTSLYGHLKRGPTSNENQDPFANLGLRVSMPSYLITPQPSAVPKPRTRTISNMYSLGLGPGRSTSAPFPVPRRNPVHTGTGIARSAAHEDDIE